MYQQHKYLSTILLPQSPISGSSIIHRQSQQPQGLDKRSLPIRSIKLHPLYTRRLVTTLRHNSRHTMHERPISQPTIDEFDQSIHVIKVPAIIRLDLGNPTEHPSDPLDVGILVVGTDRLWITAEVDVGVQRWTSLVVCSFA